MTRHDYGGLWTREKLKALENYSNFFTTALKNIGFKLHYADAFAGTGEQHLKLQDGQDLLFPEEDFEGSQSCSQS